MSKRGARSGPLDQHATSGSIEAKAGADAAPDDDVHEPRRWPPGVEPGRRRRSRTSLGDDRASPPTTRTGWRWCPSPAARRAVLTASLDRPVSSAANGRRRQAVLFFLVEDDRAQYVARVPAERRRGRAAHDAAAASSRTLSTGTPTARSPCSPRRPTEPFEVHALENGQLRRLSTQNDEWLKAVQLATTEDFTSKARTAPRCTG